MRESFWSTALVALLTVTLLVWLGHSALVAFDAMLRPLATALQ